MTSTVEIARFAGAGERHRAEESETLRLVLYFDHNATSPLCDAARDTWLDATRRFVGNPSSPHRLGARADVALENARVELASLLGCKPAHVVWNSGATEGNNTVLRSCSARLGEAWISAIEHPSILEPARRYFEGRLQTIPVTAAGVTDLGWIRERLATGPAPAVVAVMAANNETGVLQPWKAIAELCEQAGVPYLCDASQWIGKLPSAGFERVTYVTGCAHKFGGPVGVGFLLSSDTLSPLVVGGPQENRFRAGTENVAGVLASVAALKLRHGQVSDPQFIRERREARAKFIDELSKRLPTARALGENDGTLWNTVSVVLPEIDCRQRWVVKVDKLGAAVSTGSACSSGQEKTSHVLAAMGVPAGEASRVLRVSGGWETTPEDWDALVNIIAQAAKELGAV